MKRMVSVSSNAAGLACEVGGEAILASKLQGPWLFHLSCDTIWALVCANEISSTRPPEYFIKVVLAVYILPNDMRPLLHKHLNLTEPDGMFSSTTH